MFLTLGLVTVLVGTAVILFLPDTPMKAKWLSDNEKVALLKHVSVNKTGVENRKFRAKEIVEALMDPQVYLLLLSVVLVSVRSFSMCASPTDFDPAFRLQWCRHHLLGDFNS